MDATHDTTADPAPLDLEAALRGIPAAAALPEAAFTDLAQSVLAELELRIGEQLSAGLTEAQLEEFEAISDYEAEHPGSFEDGNGPAAAWLEANCPGFRHAARKVLEDLLAQTSALLDSQPSTPQRGKPTPRGPAARGPGESLPQATHPAAGRASEPSTTPGTTTLEGEPPWPAATSATAPPSTAPDATEGGTSQESSGA